MVVAVSARNRLIWSVTSRQIRDHWSVFHNYLRGQSSARGRWNFGNGEEAAFRCPRCKRYYPLFTATIDHVVPRSEIQIEYTDSEWGNCFLGTRFRLTRQGMLSVIPFDADRRAVRLKYKIGSDNVMQCYEQFESDIIFSFDPCTLVENLLDNLQPMCAHCNSCKGNRY